MDFTELAKNRYSVRKFAARKVEEDKQKIIMEAAKLAPTAKNLQPQRILTLESEKSLEKLSRATACAYGCALAYVICYDDSVSYKRDFDGKDSGDIDAAITATHMMLAAYEIGIGSTWVMAFDPKAVKEQFNLPGNIHPTAILVMGYPAEDAVPAPRHTQRVDVNELFVGESF